MYTILNKSDTRGYATPIGVVEKWTDIERYCVISNLPDFSWETFLPEDAPINDGHPVLLKLPQHEARKS